MAASLRAAHRAVGLATKGSDADAPKTNLESDVLEELNLNLEKTVDERQTNFLFAWGTSMNGQLGFNPNKSRIPGGMEKCARVCTQMTETVGALSDDGIKEAAKPRLTWLPPRLRHGNQVEF